MQTFPSYCCQTCGACIGWIGRGLQKMLGKFNPHRCELVMTNDDVPARPRLVILESPFAGDVGANLEYGRACVRDSLLRGEAPIASHLLYTQPGILNDDVPEERQHGIDAGLAWKEVAEASVVYTDRGISKGMQYGIAAAQAVGIPIEYRTIL